MGPLTLVGLVFVGLQTLAPLHQVVSKNLGSRTAAWLYDDLMARQGQFAEFHSLQAAPYR